MRSLVLIAALLGLFLSACPQPPSNPDAGPVSTPQDCCACLISSKVPNPPTNDTPQQCWVRNRDEITHPQHQQQDCQDAIQAGTPRILSDGKCWQDQGSPCADACAGVL